MRSVFSLFACAFVLTWFVHASPVSAQAKTEEPDENAPEAAETEESEEPKAGGREDQPVGDVSRRLIARLTRLHGDMEKSVDLGEEQAKAIHELFEGKFKDLKQRGAKSERGEKDDENLAVLREELREAQKAGDRDLVKDIRRQIREKLRAERSKHSADLSDFFAKVEGELDEEQVREFHRLVERHGFGNETATAGTDINSLFRAVLHPSVELSPEQKRSIMGIMTESFEAADTDKRTEEQIAEASAHFRNEVMGELSPSQWQRVEELLKNPSAMNRDSARKAPPGEKKTDESEKEEEKPDE